MVVKICFKICNTRDHVSYWHLLFQGEYVELKNSTRYQQSVLLIMQELSSRDKENSPDETGTTELLLPLTTAHRLYTCRMNGQFTQQYNNTVPSHI